MEKLEFKKIFKKLSLILIANGYVNSSKPLLLLSQYYVISLSNYAEIIIHFDTYTTMLDYQIRSKHWRRLLYQTYDFKKLSDHLKDHHEY